MNSPEILLQQAETKLKEGYFEEALDGFSACLALEPKHLKALQGRALAEFQLKQWAEAEADFSLAKSLDKNDPENWRGFALSLAMQNKIYEAIAVFEDLVERQPDYVEAPLQLGLLYFKIGAIAKGREYMAKAISLRPNLAQRRLIESLLREQDKLDKNRYYRPDFEKLRQKK